MVFLSGGRMVIHSEIGFCSLVPLGLGFPCGSAGKESACNAGAWVDPWVGKIPWRRERLPTPVFCPALSLCIRIKFHSVSLPQPYTSLSAPPAPQCAHTICFRASQSSKWRKPGTLFASSFCRGL